MVRQWNVTGIGSSRPLCICGCSSIFVFDRIQSLWQVGYTVRNVTASENGNMDRIRMRQGMRCCQSTQKERKGDDGK